MNRTDVNGNKQHPAYTFLKAQCPSPDGMIMGNHDDIIWSPVKSGDISWNFEKFLIDHHGKPVLRFKPSVNPKDLGQEIERLIANCQSEMGNVQEDFSLDF